MNIIICDDRIDDRKNLSDLLSDYGEKKNYEFAITEMAALIYLNLYFASAEPENELFAHNFILFVPSGLKSSIIPSLRDIQNFNPLWILPDPVASQLKNKIQFEWLQEASSASKSNIVKNPNARKISMHTSKPDLMGLVAVTNAEKVILDRVDRNLNFDETLLKNFSEAERKEYEAALQANELREHIGRIPGLCILIDEVHHASDNQKLRQVVNKWMEQSNFNSVLGFSGTPNMDPPINVNITSDLSVKCTFLWCLPMEDLHLTVFLQFSSQVRRGIHLIAVVSYLHRFPAGDNHHSVPLLALLFPPEYTTHHWPG